MKVVKTRKRTPCQQKIRLTRLPSAPNSKRIRIALRMGLLVSVALQTAFAALSLSVPSSDSVAHQLMVGSMVIPRNCFLVGTLMVTVAVTVKLQKTILTCTGPSLHKVMLSRMLLQGWTYQLLLAFSGMAHASRSAQRSTRPFFATEPRT